MQPLTPHLLGMEATFWNASFVSGTMPTGSLCKEEIMQVTLVN